MPGMRSIGSGARNAASRPGQTSRKPSGLQRSEAIFATDLVVASPIDTGSRVSARIARRIRSAVARGGPWSRSVPVRSRYASSIETASTAGVKRWRTARTARAARR